MILLPSFCPLNARQIICCIHFVSTMETSFLSSLVQCCPDLITLFPASSLVQLWPTLLALLPAPLGHGEGVWTRNEQGQRKGQSGKSWIKLQFLSIIGGWGGVWCSVQPCVPAGPWPAMEGGCTAWLVALAPPAQPCWHQYGAFIWNVSPRQCWLKCNALLAFK